MSFLSRPEPPAPEVHLHIEAAANTTGREDHQQKILEDFQSAQDAKDKATKLLADATRIAEESEAAFTDAQRALRSVANGVV